jgi:hypothetical protein
MGSIFSGYDVDKVEEFEWWFWDNLEEYRVIQDCIKEFSKRGEKFSLRVVLDNLRCGLVGNCRVSINNDFIPMLQRRLEVDRPDLVKYLTKRGKKK